MRKLSLLILCVTVPLLSGCPEDIVIPNTTLWTIPGQIADGMIGHETNTSVLKEINYDEVIKFLEPQVEPQRAGAICQTAADANKIKTILEIACRDLGDHCTYEMHQTITALKEVLIQRKK